MFIFFILHPHNCLTSYNNMHMYISPAFNNIRQTTSIQLQLLINYLTNTWLNNTTWSVQQWSVFRQDQQ
jgi:hypothetical protein